MSTPFKSILENVNVNDYNCIHAYTLFTDGNCAYELNKKYHIPYVVAVRATDIYFYKYRINLRKRGLKILRNASKIFFLSEVTKNIFINKYVPKKYRFEILSKIKIIPNGIDDFWLNNCYKDKKCQLFNSKNINIITVSQIIKRKNIPKLQTAIKFMIKDGWNVKLNLIGKDVNKKLTKKIIKDRNTTYYNHMKKEELIKFYRENDFFVLPSKGETFGLVYAEAMSQGLPVIYSKNEGFDGQFKDGIVGYAIDARSPKDITNKIYKIINNYKTTSKNCLENVNRFNWEEICIEYKNVYLEVINKS